MPVICIADDDRESVENLTDAGVAEVLVRPVNLPALRAALDRCGRFERS